MPDRLTWAPGSNPPGLTAEMRAAGQVWQRRNPSRGGFLWEPVTAKTGAPKGVGPVPASGRP